MLPCVCAEISHSTLIVSLATLAELTNTPTHCQENSNSKQFAKQVLSIKLKTLLLAGKLIYRHAYQKGADCMQDYCFSFFFV